MAVFFVEWELWQEMTFVLACCIVAVFVLGTIRLWWTTRTMRKLEVIDEEKRARISDIRHCGIDDWHADNIPFGVRALHTGVEVDGIWVSRPHAPPKWSQVASSATLMGDHMDDAKGKSKCSESNESSDTRHRHPSDNSTIDQLLYDSGVQDPPGVNASPHAALVPATSTRQASERLPGSSNDGLRLYLPTGWQSPGSSPGAPSYVGSSSAPSASPAHLTSSNIPSTLGTPRRIISPVHGQVTVHANKTTRRPNENFEILPAGELGPRPDVQELNPLRSLEEIRLPHFQPGPAKLRKKNAPPRAGERLVLC